MTKQKPVGVPGSRKGVRMPPPSSLGPQLRDPKDALSVFTVLKEAFATKK